MHQHGEGGNYGCIEEIEKEQLAYKEVSKMILSVFIFDFYKLRDEK
jgi:hypothetical protein